MEKEQPWPSYVGKKNRQALKDLRQRMRALVEPDRPHDGKAPQEDRSDEEA